MSIPPCDSSSLPPPNLEAARAPHPHFAAPAPSEDAPPPPILNPLEPLPIPETVGDWMAILRDAMTYPPRKDGWFILLPGALLGIALVVGTLFGLHLAVFPLVFGSGFFAAYYLSVIETTISGRDQPPDWPSLSSISEDLIQPLLAVGLAALVSSVPAIAYYLAVPEDNRIELVALMLDWLGKIYFPMALLSYVMQGNVWSLLPHQVLPSILRSCSGYLIVTGLLVAMGLISDAAFAMTQFISWLWPLLGFLVWLWFIMVHGRLLGLFYLRYQQRLGW